MLHELGLNQKKKASKQKQNKKTRRRGFFMELRYCIASFTRRTSPSDEPEVAEASAAGLRLGVVGAERVEEPHAQRPSALPVAPLDHVQRGLHRPRSVPAEYEPQGELVPRVVGGVLGVGYRAFRMKGVGVVRVVRVWGLGVWGFWVEG